MAVRVLIEREIDPGNELRLNQLLMDLRAKAMQAKGYISGETLRALNNPNIFLVISTWNTVDDWIAWENSPERKKFLDQLNKYMRSPEKASVYVYL